MRSESIDAGVKAARRRFLANCGKFAVATPPAISLLLAASRANYAVASSGGSNGGSGGGSGGGGGGNAPLLGDPPTNTQNSPTGASAAGQSCGNTFQALADNDKCFR